MKTVGVM